MNEVIITEYTDKKKSYLKSRKRCLKVVAMIILAIIVLLEGISWFFVFKLSHPKIREYKLDSRKYDVKQFEKVKFKSLKDDVQLNGYLVSSPNSKKTIIMCHGYSDNKFIVGSKGTSEIMDYLELAKIFKREGYNTLIFDFRGHGECGKNAGVTIGFNEQQDLLGALKFIKQKGIGQTVGLFGASMGAATSLSVLDKTKDISFVIADSPFSDLKDYLSNNIKTWTGLPKFPFAPITILNFKIAYGIDYDKVSPINSVKKSNIPILLMHGKKDSTIKYTESIKISNKFKNKKSRIVLFDASVHIGSYYMYPKQYEESVTNFLRIMVSDS